MTNVTVDLSAIDELERDLDKFRNRVLAEVANRGQTLLRREVPEQTGELRRGVSAPAIDYKNGRAVINVSAVRARRGARNGTLHLKSGKTKSIKLLAIPEFDYAEIVARGRRAISPKSAQVLIIPVSSAPNGKNYRYSNGKYTVSSEPYIVADGQIYIVSSSAKAKAANPFDERAARQLQGEIVQIVEAVQKIVLG